MNETTYQRILSKCKVEDKIVKDLLNSFSNMVDTKGANRSEVIHAIASLYANILIKSQKKDRSRAGVREFFNKHERRLVKYLEGK